MLDPAGPFPAEVKVMSGYLMLDLLDMLDLFLPTRARMQTDNE